MENSNAHGELGIKGTIKRYVPWQETSCEGYQTCYAFLSTYLPFLPWLVPGRFKLEYENLAAAY